MRSLIWPSALFLALAVGACAVQDEDDDIAAPDTTTADVSVYWSEERLTMEEIEAGRYEEEWRAAPSIDSLIATDTIRTRRIPADSIVIPERWEDIGPGDLVTVDTTRVTGSGRDTTPGAASRSGTTPLPDLHLPLGGQVGGPSVLYAQILLDRSPFAPGVIDGRWGKNTEKAVFWLQQSEGLPATGQIDSVTFRRLVDLAGRLDRYLQTVALTEEDVAGPFVDIPEDVTAQAELSCLCYSSRSEKLAERFHVTPDVLERLNPDATLDSLAAGDSLRVPNVERLARADLAMRDSLPADSVPRGAADTAAQRDPAGDDLPGGTDVARIVISDRGRYLHVLDSSGRILYHFPTTLGSSYSPSPSGRLEVVRIAREPWFHWQPELLEGVDPNSESARLPPGANSPVGLVWMQLSRDHYGIHGTSEPATIGYATSSGCVRLTNWDALFLASLIEPGTPVEFRDLASAPDPGSDRRPPANRLPRRLRRHEPPAAGPLTHSTLRRGIMIR